jgi:hypothetical protein
MGTGFQGCPGSFFALHLGSLSTTNVPLSTAIPDGTSMTDPVSFSISRALGPIVIALALLVI